MDNRTSRNLKEYKEVIKVEISVNDIADELLSKMNPENNGNELIVETLIDNLRHSPEGLGQLYNSLYGRATNIDFKVGDIVECSRQTYAYRTEKDINSNKTSYDELGVVKILEVDMAATEKVRVEYHVYNNQGVPLKQEMWVKHTTLNHTSKDMPVLKVIESRPKESDKPAPKAIE